MPNIKYIVVETIHLAARPIINEPAMSTVLAYSFASKAEANAHVMERLEAWQGSKVEIKEICPEKKFYSGTEYWLDNGDDTMSIMVLFDRSQLKEAMKGV